MGDECVLEVVATVMTDIVCGQSTLTLLTHSE